MNKKCEEAHNSIRSRHVANKGSQTYDQEKTLSKAYKIVISKNLESDYKLTFPYEVAKAELTLHKKRLRITRKYSQHRRTKRDIEFDILLSKKFNKQEAFYEKLRDKNKRRLTKLKELEHKGNPYDKIVEEFSIN